MRCAYPSQSVLLSMNPVGWVELVGCLVAVVVLLGLVVGLNRFVRRNTRRPDYEQVTQERLFARRSADEHEQNTRDGTGHAGGEPPAV